MKSVRLLLLVAVLSCFSGCKKEEDDLIKLPAWFRNKFWNMTSIELNGVEVPDTMQKYFPNYRFKYEGSCDPLKVLCGYNVRFLWDGGSVYYDKGEHPFKMSLFVGGKVRYGAFLFKGIAVDSLFPIPELVTAHITKLNKKELEITSPSSNAKVYKVTYKADF